MPTQPICLDNCPTSTTIIAVFNADAATAGKEERRGGEDDNNIMTITKEVLVMQMKHYEQD